MQTIDNYLENLDVTQATALQNVRDIIHQAAPQAEEGIAHTIPAFIYKGHPLIGFAAHPEYLGIYTFKPEAIAAFKDELDGFELKSRVIEFTPEKLVPSDVLEAVTHYLMDLIDSSVK